MPQSSGAEVEFHVCNYWTTGCKISIWAVKNEGRGGWGVAQWSERKDSRGWKVHDSWLKSLVFFLSVCFILKETDRGILQRRWYTTSRVVNIREMNAVVNNAGLTAQRSLVQETTHSTVHPGVDNATTLSCHSRKIILALNEKKKKKSTGYILNPGWMETGTQL